MIVKGRNFDLRRLLPPVVFATVAVIYMVIATGFSDTSAEAPMLYGEVLLGLSVLVFIKSFFPDVEKEAAAVDESKLKTGPESKSESFDWKKSGAILAMIFAFVMLVFAIGFYIAIPLFLLLFLKFISKVSWLGAAICAAASFVFIWFVFSWFLHLEVFAGYFPVTKML